ncbi:TAF11 [Sanghuangporus vaninii]
MSSPPGQTSSFRASTPAPSTPSLGGGGRKTTAGTKKGRKSRAASTAPSVADSQSTAIQWATPIQASTSDAAGASKVGATTSGPIIFTDPLSGGTVPPSSGRAGMDEDVEGEEDLLPDMADDDYSAQLSWQSQSKDNLKVLMDNFSPDQYDRYEAYRRNALPKQAVRRVIQQSLGAQVSAPVAQIVAGFSKVFVGEIVEKARKVQERRGETGPLAPDHLREAYRQYQKETGRVGAARPLRGKKLFVR